ncbi:essential component of the nuclear pore complex [Pseudozyma hubeiensis SY62]|uniref:Essential component of the nuclear pore complex n=1 Tax=Pseudozyma hubeiensis (strain SY62) TaxID=1305764 RepID=R9P8N3_PSEHS|nr:essential component of the nuclear pore complex [Pseudozyma hubeiensis SY62]GAC97743.1 essential component of the nuclear pore complex [Pseudozyma hubeiensis SY62]
MDFPSQYPESPAKPLAGPARARVLARQNRTTTLKPYARRQSSGLTASGSVTSLHTETDSPVRTPSTPNTKTLAPLSTQPARSAFSPLRAAAAPIALLGSVRKMVTKPLSWLTSVASSVEPELGIPTSSSTNSLSSIARKRAAAQASLKSGNNDSSYERDAPTRAARAVGERLAAGLLSRSNLHDDEESQLRPPTSTLSSSRSMSRLAPAPAPARATRHQSPFIQETPIAGPSAPSRSSDKPTMWSSRSSKRTLEVGARPVDDDKSIDAMSDVSRTSPSRSHAHHSRSQHALRSPRSQMLGYRGSSLRPDDAMSESGSTSLSHSHSFSAFGYGNEIRYTDSAFGLPPSSSPFQLSSRNTLGHRTRAPFSSGLFTETGTPGRTSRAGSVSIRGASPAPSAGYSPARHREGTPQRRNWNGVNLAAPSVPSVGDEMMREYLASRTLPGINPSVRRNLGLSADEPMITSSSVAGGSVIDETESVTPSRLGKRDIDMSVDGDSERLGAAGTPSKRRMVWHPELGFISHEELKAREPKLPSPKNEAERLLNVLETLRKPTSSRGAAQAKGPSAQIHVPAPISDLPSAKTARSQEGKQTIGVAPYTRYLRKAKTVQSVDQQGGMRAKLKKVQRANVMEVDDAATEDSAASENEDANSDDDEEQEEKEEEEEEEEDEPAPPQPEPVRRSRRLQHQAPNPEEVVQTPVKQVAKPARATQLKSALKATPLRAAAQPQATPAKAAAETPRPASHRIPLSAATKAPSSIVKKDNFVVKTSSDPTAPRERSSLRQGAAKTSRTHQSSGKFSAWDDDEEEEDLPEAGDLAKIKLPTNMFPSGFSFGSSAATETATTSEATSSEATSKSVDSAQSSSGGSLLSRLGGFDSSSPSSQKSEAPKSAAQVPSFSFSAPSKDAPDALPKFSFGNSASNATSKEGDSSSKKSAAPPASDFFSKPAEPASKSLDEAKKDGPVPNFFGSTMKKFESRPAGAPTAPTAAGGFSFGAPAASGKPNDDAASSKPASFSFGAPKPNDESASSPVTTSNTFGSFGAKPTQSTERKAESAAATTPSFFGSSSAALSASGFSFGAPSTPTATTGSKRGADDEDEPAAKKSMPSFSFGAPAAAAAAAAATPTASKPAGSGFNFGAPAAGSGEKKDDAATAGMPNFFGAKGNDTAKPAVSTTSGGFSFGKAASENASGGFGASKPADSASSVCLFGCYSGRLASDVCSGIGSDHPQRHLHIRCSSWQDRCLSDEQTREQRLFVRNTCSRRRQQRIRQWYHQHQRIRRVRGKARRWHCRNRIRDDGRLTSEESLRYTVRAEFHVWLCYAFYHSG